MKIFLHLASREVVRFFAVALMGLVIDIAVGSAMIGVLGMADIPAAAIGLFAGMVSNYFFHLRWTFASAGTRASLGLFIRFCAGVAVTLIFRSAILWIMGATGMDIHIYAPVRLTISAGLGFLLSYEINRRLVFNPARSQDVFRS